MSYRIGKVLLPCGYSLTRSLNEPFQLDFLSILHSDLILEIRTTFSAMVTLSSPTRSRQSYERLKTGIQARASGVPSRYWICGAVGTALCLALLAVGSQERHTEQIWAKAGEVSTVLKAKTFGIPIPKEALGDADYFVQNAIAPASWSRTYNPPSVSRSTRVSSALAVLLLLYYIHTRHGCKLTLESHTLRRLPVCT